MSNRGRAFWKKAGRSAWICAAVLAVLAGALYLTVKEYGLNARFALSPDGPQADSIALSVAHRLKSDYLAKGGALSAMEGDFSCLLAKSIAEPKGRVNKALNSFSPDSSLLAMKKLCVRARGMRSESVIFHTIRFVQRERSSFSKTGVLEWRPRG